MKLPLDLSTFHETAAARFTQVARFLETWLSGTEPVQYTPKGLAWASEWGTLRYTMNAALIAEVVAKQIASKFPSLSAPLLSYLCMCVCVCVCMSFLRECSALG